MCNRGRLHNSREYRHRECGRRVGASGQEAQVLCGAKRHDQEATYD